MSDHATASGTSPSLGERLLTTLRTSFSRQRKLAERALAQVTDDAFSTQPAEDGNSLAILVKHLAGNLRSRFTDFLTRDGEKPDRHRDQEFVLGADETRSRLMARWAAGWQQLEATLADLDVADLDASVTIRGEPYGVVEALLRAHGHIGYHVGQMVLVARASRGEAWRSLSIPRGGSVAYNQAVDRGEVTQRRLPDATSEPTE